MNALTAMAAAACIAAAVFASPSQAATDPVIRQSGNIAYASGGVSEEARDNLSAIARDFNVKLVLATKSGAYLSDVAVVVSDSQGQRVLAAKSDGPWFYAKLPSGRYTIEASSNGAVMKKAVSVATQGTSQVDFRWDD